MSAMSDLMAKGLAAGFGRAVGVLGFCAACVAGCSVQLDPTSANAVFEAVSESLAAADAVSATMTVGPMDEGVTFQLRFQKPNLYSLTSASQGFVSDGSTQWLWFVDQKVFYRTPVSDGFSAPFLSIGLERFFATGEPAYVVDGIEAADWRQHHCRVLTLRRPEADGLFWRLYVDDKDVPLAWEQCADDVSQPLVQAQYHDLRRVAPIEAACFAWSPPTDYIEKMFGDPQESLKTGSMAPPIEGHLIDGDRFSLRTTAKSAKVVLVNFWFIGCAPCRAELPVLQRLADEAEALGLRIVLVNSSDKTADIQRVLGDAGIKLPCVADSTLSTQFKVSAFPTSFLIRPDGSVADVVVGFDELQLKAALERLGIHLQ